ncbi:MAG: PqqD family protein [Candidatus Gygaella obscura]|nr:PqqD family protein [Candidatus Gygaella obscura]
MEMTVIPRKEKDFVSRDFDNEAVLIPVFKKVDESNCIYSLNETGQFIWKLINGKNSLRKIRNALVKNFDITEEQAEKELSKFINSLLKVKAIKILK